MQPTTALSTGQLGSDRSSSTQKADLGKQTPSTLGTKKLMTMKDLMQQTDGVTDVPLMNSMSTDDEFKTVDVQEAEVDEVFDPALVDVFLRHDYDNLPRLE